MADFDTGVGQLAHDAPNDSTFDEGDYIPPSWVLAEQDSSPTPSNIASYRVTGAVWAEARRWRSPEVKSLFLALYGDHRGFYAHCDQWELDLGDVLPLQTQPARTERSDGAQAGGAAAHG